MFILHSMHIARVCGMYVCGLMYQSAMKRTRALAVYGVCKLCLVSNCWRCCFAHVYVRL